MPNQLDVEGAVEKGEKKLNEEAARKQKREVILPLPHFWRNEEFKRSDYCSQRKDSGLV